MQNPTVMPNDVSLTLAVVLLIPNNGCCFQLTNNIQLYNLMQDPTGSPTPQRTLLPTLQPTSVPVASDPPKEPTNVPAVATPPPTVVPVTSDLTKEPTLNPVHLSQL